MLNFTVGPVQSSEGVRNIGFEQVPYFRTSEFSDVMLENEKMMKRLVNAEESARVLFITGSGTASMEASVANTLTKNDNVLVVNGGSFGHRFVELLSIYEIPYSEIQLEFGKSLSEEELRKYDNKGYTAFLVNIHETSTGVLYDLNMISEFCNRNRMFLIVDAISSFLADEIDMKGKNIDVLITGSQKALACPPGVSIVVLSSNAINRVQNNHPRCMYLDLKIALENGERGQTPFTPAVGILRQIYYRLKEIEENGGVRAENKRIADLANDFRERIAGLPFDIFSESMSNAVTPLHPRNVSANDIFLKLKDEYNIWVCPNGGILKDVVFRVGHIGTLTKEDNTVLINALLDMQKRGLL